MPHEPWLVNMRTDWHARFDMASPGPDDAAAFHQEQGVITNSGWLRWLLVCAALLTLAACEDRPQDAAGMDAAVDASDDNDSGN